MTQLGAGMIRDAAEIRMRVADQCCPAKANNGEHNTITVSHWFRRFDVCATCGYVERAR